ncbi:MAG: membrane protein insertase YidC [Candidatus Binatia bacterium]
MDKRSLLAIALSILILVGYQELISFLYPPSQQPPQQQQMESHPSPSPSSDVSRSPAETIRQTAQARETPTPLQTAEPAVQDLTVENDVYSAVLTSLGGRLKSVRLKHYPGDRGKDSPPREMVTAGTDGELPLIFRLEGGDMTLSDENVAYTTTSGENLQLQGESQAIVEFKGRTANGVQITKTFGFSGDTYGITLTVRVENPPATANFASLVWTHGPEPHHKNSSYYHPGPVALIDRKFVYEYATALTSQEKDLGPGRIRWGGYADTYFLAALMPLENEANHLFVSDLKGTALIRLTIPWKREPISYEIYVGPKDFTALNAVNPALDRAIDFGWFHFIARPLVHLLRFSHSYTGNYGIDIILLTFLVKLVFFPLTNKSFRSMAQMREVQPLMERLREQYKDDREKLNKEMMELYRNHKVNPLGGCLPMLVQAPVFIGLYQALSSAIELRQAPFLGWIQDLSMPDRLGSLDLWFIEPPGVPVLTLLMGGTMLVQQALTPAMGDPVQQKMMMLMPVIFTVMFVNFPSGLVLYWLVNNVLSITQQYAYQKGLV